MDTRPASFNSFTAAVSFVSFVLLSLEFVESSLLDFFSSVDTRPSSFNSFAAAVSFVSFVLLSLEFVESSFKTIFFFEPGLKLNSSIDTSFDSAFDNSSVDARPSFLNNFAAAVSFVSFVLLSLEFVELS